MATLPISLIESCPLVRIVGPTGVGKTALTWVVAQELQKSGLVKGIDVISADSRQVYQGLTTLTGVDLPVGSQALSSPAGPYFLLPEPEFGSVRVFGQVFLPLTATWSLGQQLQLLEVATREAWAAGRLPIIVGGTGLYQTPTLVSGAPARVPPNEALRAELAELDLETLQHRLQHTSLGKWQSMTRDDQLNPRRLMRAIELAVATTSESIISAPTSVAVQPTQTVAVGLTAPITDIETKIESRVKTRWAASLDEVRKVLGEIESGAEVASSVMTATGFKELMAFEQGDASQVETEERWVRRERQYAKRQLTWWKKYGQGVQWWNSVGPEVFVDISKFVAHQLLENK